MERKHILVAFGDILGFGTWRRRAATTQEIAEPFIRNFYDIMQSFSEKNPDLYIKYLGDGLMVLREFSEHSKISDPCFIHQVGLLNAMLLKAVRDCAYPSPEAFRMRLAVGYVDKIMVTDPLDQKRKIPEYVGYCINLAQRLLEIAPAIPLVCHESVQKLFWKKKNTFKFRKLYEVKERPRGIDLEDIESLWSIEF